MTAADGLAEKAWLAEVLMGKKKLFSEVPHIEGERLVIGRITQDDADALEDMVKSDKVYALEPTFLFERKYDDVHVVIDRLYDEAFEESIIMGIYLDGEFCGIAELYGYRDEIHKVSVGIRLREKYQHMGIGAEALSMVVEYLLSETDIEIIAASSLPDNAGSAGILRKCGFDLVVHNGPEDWGFGEPVPTDKWIK